MPPARKSIIPQFDFLKPVSYFFYEIFLKFQSFYSFFFSCKIRSLIFFTTLKIRSLDFFLLTSNTEFDFFVFVRKIRSLIFLVEVALPEMHPAVQKVVEAEKAEIFGTLSLKDFNEGVTKESVHNRYGGEGEGGSRGRIEGSKKGEGRREAEQRRGEEGSRRRKGGRTKEGGGGRWEKVREGGREKEGEGRREAEQRRGEEGSRREEGRREGEGGRRRRRGRSPVNLFRVAYYKSSLALGSQKEALLGLLKDTSDHTGGNLNVCGGRRKEEGGWRMEDGGWRKEEEGRRKEDGGLRMEDEGRKEEKIIL
jgi:hypothetical protein